MQPFSIRLALACATAVAAATPAAATAAPFTAGNVAVERVGSGSAALSSAATPVFVDEFSGAGAGAAVQSFALPTTAVDVNRRLTESGSATSDGYLNRSADGQSLVLPGYDAAVGTAGVVSTPSTLFPRVLGRIAQDGTIDTTTRLTDSSYSNSNIRSAATTDGTNLFAGGTAGIPANGGVRFTTLGAATSTLVSPTVTNVRVVGIFGGQLYFSTGSGATGIYKVGTGTPTTAGNVATLVAPVTNPYQFVFLDRDTAVPGPETLYVADETAGIRKFSLDAGGVATARGTLAGPVRGLTGRVSGATAELFTTTTATTGNTLQRLTDTAASTANIAAAGPTTLATAPANTVFRGVALAPENPAPTPITSCDDPRAITGSGMINGTAGDDYICGSNGGDVINGLGGNDTVVGRDGNDVIYGGAGDDTISGGDGNDTILDEAGADTVNGDAGNDVLGAGTGKDSYVGGAGTDRVTYATRSASVTVIAGANASGEAGEQDTIDSSVEDLRGGEGADTITGDDNSNTLTGNGGGDTIAGGGGNDRVRGGNGDDDVNGAAGDDVVEGNGGNDILSDGPGVDQLLAGPGTDRLTTSTDGNKDNASCGTDADTVTRGDRDDYINRDCEVRN